MLALQASIALSQSFPFKSQPSAPYSGLGASAAALYDVSSRFTLGIQVKSLITTTRSIQMAAGPYRLDAALARRETTLGAVFRHYLSTERDRTYLEFAPASIQFEMSHYSKELRIFFRGYGAWVGAG